ncbi:MAG: hypothetical protein J07AB43_02400 [Candidatus Nanosalina sp. J07AB43]|jgi:hypothetical protein|nr:MAG: hypothetical protein J07AB43_02400 [Candidatus Nanosalina sp. J07AB43]
MSQEIQVDLNFNVPNAESNPEVDVFDATLLVEDDKGFTEEQLALYLAEQLSLSIRGLESIDGVEQTDQQEYVP